MGEKHYTEAVDCYTRAINQKVLSESENSIIYANRSHVNLLLGNYRRALTDAEEAAKLCPTNVKVVRSLYFAIVHLIHNCGILHYLNIVKLNNIHIDLGTVSCCQGVITFEFIN